MMLYQMLLAAGYPESEMAHHESDLYVLVTPLTQKVIRQWQTENGYHLGSPLFSTFTDQITGKRMYDIAFAYDPFWEGRN